ncbi:MAG: FKBP-type peptidyl-prolyl cis-trans isomerase [Acidobacteria bacterium]|nr:FKBP-type peptidyl-prolyl cis-trans isomerase [Acidobacteriota bacterium]
MMSKTRGLMAIATAGALAVAGCTSQNPLAPGGVAFFAVTDIRVGSGATAAIGTRVTINYVAWLFDDDGRDDKGMQVDSGNGLTFVVGGSQTIGGFDQGVVGMRVGGLRRVIIPPDLGFGASAAGLISADSALIADITLVAVEPVVTDSAPFTITDLVVGNGAVAATGDVVVVAFGGWLYDKSRPDGKGARFDTSSRFPFTLGAGQVIEGWERGIPGMRENGERRLIIPPELGFGNTQRGIIPANATLLFDVTLFTVTR